ncbi:hypothetical protein LX36DRAFT_455388 [Colletotrichum falcatum]|nr:hypothetical protein LX36DRAFT_455388 [Colletotrichum falcatum]
MMRARRTVYSSGGCIYLWMGFQTFLLVGLSDSSSPVMIWVLLGVYGKGKESCCFVC